MMAISQVSAGFQGGQFQSSMPKRLVGLWRRLSIEENGERDVTTQVFWLQTTCGFADIRIPAERPSLASWATLKPHQAIALAKQDGFAGITHLSCDNLGRNRCEWHHAMDYRPFNGHTDVGLLHWQDDILIEIAPDGRYKEEWQRVETGPTATLTLTHEGRWKGWLVICGDYFIYMWDERKLLPAAKSLTSLISSSPTASNQYLNCEISFGRIQKGDHPWNIQLSTLPWREGKSLWEGKCLALLRGASRQVVQTANGQSLTWTVQEWEEHALQALERQS